MGAFRSTGIELFPFPGSSGPGPLLPGYGFFWRLHPPQVQQDQVAHHLFNERPVRNSTFPASPQAGMPS